jgi:HK97 family phage portal protein
MGVWSRIATAGRVIWQASDERTPGPADDYWYGPLGQRTGVGVVITPQVALKASAVFACINKIAKIMSTLSVDVFREVDDTGEREVDTKHPLHELLRHQPNPNDTAVDFWHFCIWNALLRGTGYARIDYARDGSIQALTPLHSGHVRTELLPTGRWRFVYRDPLRPDLGEQRILQDEIFRFPGLVPNGVEGLGITDCADEAVAVALAADQYAARVFQNNLNMGVILTHPGKLTKESKDRFLQALRDRLAGVANSHNPLLLQDGIKVEKASQTASEAQLLEARKWQLAEICRALDMPGSMVGIEDNGGARATVEEHSLNFVRFTLQPWAKKIEQAIRRDLIVPAANGKRDHEVEFNFDTLLRGNSTARADYFSKALGSGGSPAWMAVNEVRRREGLPRLPGAEYDKPATGTNPISPEQGAPADNGKAPPSKNDKPTPPAKGKDARAPVDPKAALLRKELTALRKAARRFADNVDAWREYASVFYGGLASDVMRRLGVEKPAARQYCQARVQQCAKAKTPQVAIEYLEANGATEIEYFVAA